MLVYIYVILYAVFISVHKTPKYSTMKAYFTRRSESRFTSGRTMFLILRSNGRGFFVVVHGSFYDAFFMNEPARSYDGSLAPLMYLLCTLRRVSVCVNPGHMVAPRKLVVFIIIIYYITILLLLLFLYAQPKDHFKTAAVILLYLISRPYLTAVVQRSALENTILLHGPQLFSINRFYFDSDVCCHLH